MEMSSKETLLSSSEVAAVFHITPVTLCRWRKTKKYNLPYLLLSNRIYYRKSDIDAFLALRRVEIQNSQKANGK